MVFVDRARQRIDSLLAKSNLVVIVSHDLGTLHKMCDRGIWMHGGQVRHDSTMDDAIGQYLTYIQAIDAANATAAAALAAVEAARVAESEAPALV